MQNIRISSTKSLRAIFVGVGLVSQRERLGGVVCGFEDGGEDAVYARDVDDGGAGFEFFDLG